jgi:hypothetical protein
MTDEQKQRAYREAVRGVIALLPDFDVLAGEEVAADERELIAG